MRYVLISDGRVVNVVEWDGQTGWEPAVLQLAKPSDTAQIGDNWNGQRFATPAAPVRAPTRREDLRMKMAGGSDLTPAEIQEAVKLLL